MLEDLVAAAAERCRAPRRNHHQERCPASPPASTCRRASRCRSDRFFVSALPASNALIEPRALPAGRRGPSRPKRMAYHLLQRDQRARRGWPPPRACPRGAAPLRLLQHLLRRRGCARCASPQRDASQPVRRRDARRSGDDGADPQLPRPVLRADGAAVALDGIGRGSWGWRSFSIAPVTAWCRRSSSPPTSPTRAKPPPT